MSLPFRAEKPDRHHCVFRLLTANLFFVGNRRDAGIAPHSVPQGVLGSLAGAFSRAFSALFGADVVFVGQESGHVGEGKLRDGPVVKGLYAVHQVIGHLGGGVHRDPGKADGSLAVDRIVLGTCDLVFSLAEDLVLAGFVPAPGIYMTAVEPERDINALDFLQMVVVTE